MTGLPWLPWAGMRACVHSRFLRADAEHAERVLLGRAAVNIAGVCGLAQDPVQCPAGQPATNARFFFAEV